VLQQWTALLNTPDEQDAVAALRQLYRDARPMYGELIFTGACEFACEHCIYPPDFARRNIGLDRGAWQHIVDGLHRELGIATFVYGGRSVTGEGIAVLAGIRARLDGLRIGVIDNGISYVPYRERLRELRLDWLDLSLDGMPADHDRQRGRDGSFDAGLRGGLWLLEHRAVERLNVLTCLTTINRRSIVPMIRMLNREGLQNFFVTPVTFSEGVRPDPSLSPSDAELVAFLDELEDAFGGLDDAYVEVGLFDLERLAAIRALRRDRLEAFAPASDHLAFHRTAADDEFWIRYFPASLTGLRELIVNSDGTVIAPKAMAHGTIPVRRTFGNLTQRPPLDIWRGVADSPAFQGYVRELQAERRVLGVGNNAC